MAIKKKGYIVVIFDENGMPRGAGCTDTLEEAKSVVSSTVSGRDKRAHIYPLPNTQDNIQVIKYRGVR